jgi:HlyD family secretion protein
MKKKKKTKPTKGLSGSVMGYMLAGLAVTFMMIGGIGGWAATTQISGAVIAPGTVVVETNVKKVQHPSGGVVGEIHVKNGSKVKEGELLLRLDETVTRANLSMITKQLDEMQVREARLKAERDNANFFDIPKALTARAAEPDVEDIINGEQSLFRSRRESAVGQKSQLQERIAQLDQEHRGITAQIEAKEREIILIAKELEGLAELELKQLVTTTKVAALKREQARLEGERGQFQASAAQAKGKAAEISLQIVRLEQELKTETVKELRETQSKQAEFVERKVAAEDQLRRIEIRAPQSGIIHQLAVFTVGGVVNPGEPIMLIVPEGDRLVIEARIAPQDIDQLFVGQNALVRFGTFDQSSTPELTASVIGVSADLTRDQVTGEQYFVSRVAIPEDQIQKLGNNKLVPGMPADVQIKTQDRTALSYIMKPLTDQIAKAFRER